MEEGDWQTQVDWVAVGWITSEKGLWVAVMQAAGSLLNVEGSLGVSTGVCSLIGTGSEAALVSSVLSLTATLSGSVCM